MLGFIIGVVPFGVEIEFHEILEVDDTGRAVGTVAFDPDDLDAAYTELDERYTAGEKLPYARAWATWQCLTQSLAAHDWGEQWASVVVPDFVLEDHRPLGWGTLRSRDDVMRYDRALVDLRPDTRLRLRHVIRPR
jgi:hypothetical protein